MRKLAVCIAALSITAMARADDKKDIATLYSALRQAMITNHPEATLALETPDFKSKGLDGRVLDGKQMVTQMKQQSAMGKLTAMNIRVTQMTVKGKTADVSTSYTASMESKDPRAKSTGWGWPGGSTTRRPRTPKGWRSRRWGGKRGKRPMTGKRSDRAWMPAARPR